MKRDMELIRALLLRTEGAEVDLSGWTAEQVGYHKVLLIESGLVRGEETTTMGGPPDGFILSLTWEGHDFIDAARDESLWKGALQQIGEKVGTVSLGILADFLKMKAREQLGM